MISCVTCISRSLKEKRAECNTLHIPICLLRRGCSVVLLQGWPPGSTLERGGGSVYSRVDPCGQPICIKLRTSPSNAVGARAVRSGGGGGWWWPRGGGAARPPPPPTQPTRPQRAPQPPPPHPPP